jgi:hypothetical protein
MTPAQPTLSQSLTDIELADLFPNLKPDGGTNTSPPTPVYNCIAHAAGQDDKWWEPGGSGYYWPPGAPPNYEANSLVAAYQAIGYTPCDNADMEDGFEKVAVYADADEEWQHAARQRSDGAWTSKLGQHQDIRHPTPECVAGEEYGRVLCVLKRLLPSHVPNSLTTSVTYSPPIDASIAPNATSPSE